MRLEEEWGWLLPVGQIELMAGGIMYGGIWLGLILFGTATVLAALAGYMKGDRGHSRVPRWRGRMERGGGRVSRSVVIMRQEEERGSMGQISC